MMRIQNKPSYLVGLIGAGIQASLSPAMHEAEGDRHGLRYMYRLIDLELLHLDASALPRLLDAARVTGFCGLNITHPCKQAVVPLLDELSDDAAAIGAVNTVVIRDGKLIGHNTDCYGFEQSMREDLASAPLDRVVQLGAGGAGAAVANALLNVGARHLSVFDIDAGRAASLVESLSRRFGPGRVEAVTRLSKAMEHAQGLVHATPTGMAAHPGLPLPAELLTPSHWFAEIVYFPLETELLRLARRLGCRCMDGRGMAVHQAVGAFQLFTGLKADGAQMRRDFEALVASRQKEAVAPATVSAV